MPNFSTEPTDTLSIVLLNWTVIFHEETSRKTIDSKIAEYEQELYDYLRKELKVEFVLRLEVSGNPASSRVRGVVATVAFPMKWKVGGSVVTPPGGPIPQPHWPGLTISDTLELV